MNIYIKQVIVYADPCLVDEAKQDREANRRLDQLFTTDDPEITVRFVDKPTNIRNEGRIPL